MSKIKVKTFEWRGSYIRYEICKGKEVIIDGWYKTDSRKSTGEIAKELQELYNTVI